MSTSTLNLCVFLGSDLNLVALIQLHNLLSSTSKLLTGWSQAAMRRLQLEQKAVVRFISGTLTHNCRSLYFITRRSETRSRADHHQGRTEDFTFMTNSIINLLLLLLLLFVSSLSSPRAGELCCINKLLTLKWQAR